MMEWLSSLVTSPVTFAVSGVETWLWLPPVVAFAVSLVSAPVGISGAFLLLPFQVSVLGFVAPAVSATNMVFNLLATPGGVAGYVRAGRMDWRLAAVISVGSVPGIAAGYVVRAYWLADVQSFKLFVGAVLLYVAWRLGRPFVVANGCEAATVDAASVRLPGLVAVTLLVGIVGGIYGIGGGSIVAPVCFAIFRLSARDIAGAAMVGTFVSSAAGVAIYSLAPAPAGVSVAPDWALGLLFAAGGLAGAYIGATLQRRLPERLMRAGLTAVLLFVALRYVVTALWP